MPEVLQGAGGLDRSERLCVFTLYMLMSVSIGTPCACAKLLACPTCTACLVPGSDIIFVHMHVLPAGALL